MAKISVQDTFGGGRKNTNGMAASVKRSAEKSSGGKLFTPTWIATKLNPHAKAISTARPISQGFNGQPNLCVIEVLPGAATTS